MVSMHPLVKILLFIVAMVLTSLLSPALLSLMLGILLVLIVLMQHKNYLQVLLRMRWLFLSVLIVYAFGTSGELVPQFPIQFAPSYEGIYLGLIQVERLLIALAALNLLLTASPKQEMISGLYLLLLPLHYLGLNIERFAARLMLTLHYVEELAENTKQSLSFDTLNYAHINASESAISTVNIQQRKFKLLDKLILMAIMLFIFALAYWNVR